jgi:hypothetical protein
MTSEWTTWISALAGPLQARSRVRLAPLFLGMTFAAGRRTASAWWRAIGVGSDFRSYYYFLAALGRKHQAIAAVLLNIVVTSIDAGDKFLFACDDSPTKRFGPHVQGAGVHHNPTPGPAGSRFLYGHSWVVLARVARHARFGSIALPLLASLYVRKCDLDKIPSTYGVRFRTKLRMAVDQIEWLHRHLRNVSKPVWLVADGFYAKAEVLRVAIQAGFVMVSRLPSNAALHDLPRKCKPGESRGRGRPRIYGENTISLAKRAGQTRGWTRIEVRTPSCETVTKRIKTFLATWRLARGVIRVVIVKEEDGSWRALLCTDPAVDVTAIVEAALERWSIEQSFHDLKEVERISEVQLRRYDANVGATNASLWYHTLVEIWSWTRPAAELADRSDRPWNDPARRPSHADRRKTSKSRLLENEFLALDVPERYLTKLRPTLQKLIRIAA